MGRALGGANLTDQHKEVQLDSTSVKAHPTTTLILYPGDDLVADPVSHYVNRPSNEGPRCVEIVAVG